MENPGRREQNKIQCRQRILKAARRLFTEKGYDAATIGELADGAEVSRGTLYHYFAGKENLLLGIAEAALEEIRQLITVELRDEPSALVKLRQAIQTLALDSVRYIALTRRILYLNSSPESMLHGSRVELLEILRSLTAQAQAQGELRRDLSPEAMADLFFGVCLLIHFGWEDISDYSEEECIQKVNAALDLVLAGLAAEGGSHAGSGI